MNINIENPSLDAHAIIAGSVRAPWAMRVRISLLLIRYILKIIDPGRSGGTLRLEVKFSTDAALRG